MFGPAILGDQKGSEWENKNLREQWAHGGFYNHAVLEHSVTHVGQASTR